MGSIALEEVPSESFGYDFEDKQTRQELELIDDLQKLGVSKYLDLPQVSNICLSFKKSYSWLLSWWSSVIRVQEKARYFKL
jgi:hypothetical protein